MQSSLAGIARHLRANDSVKISHLHASSLKLSKIQMRERQNKGSKES